ncbi:hypothetical protein, partial [Schaalia hyovaginalis]|uniref:hypothetical protein n=1 Tax=Schaalia hyovaginalis TaxID=29316 RepID=UPI002A81DE93
MEQERGRGGSAGGTGDSALACFAVRLPTCLPVSKASLLHAEGISGRINATEFASPRCEEVMISTKKSD